MNKDHRRPESAEMIAASKSTSTGLQDRVERRLYGALGVGEMDGQ
jgi:hypothetical protein